MQRKTVVLGFLGTTLDKGAKDDRWNRWRPTISLFGHEGRLRVDRLELFLSSDFAVPLAQRIAEDIGQISPHTDVFAHNLDIANPWDFASVYAALHEFATGYTFEDDCDYYVHLTTGTHTGQICLFLLTQARYFPARLVDTGSTRVEGTERWRGQLQIVDLDLSTYDLLNSRFSRETADSESLLKSGIQTRNASFNVLISEVEKVAVRSSAPILLMGPTGAGKTQLSQRIYELRHRRHLVDGAFIEVNCATLRGDNAMSTLFGHKRGAFTGAVSDRRGLLKAADGGVLMLDEIGELDLDVQAMLLRALEDHRFTPMGSDKDVESDFQLIAGTNRDLAREVAAGRFRADLLARINLWTFTLPGLSARPEDIEPNIDYEMERAGRAIGSKVSFTRDAREQYLAFSRTAPWPGNFRDLGASIVRMATLADSGRISRDDVAREIARCAGEWAARDGQTAEAAAIVVPTAAGSLVERVLDVPMDAFDAVQMEAVLSAIAATDSMASAGRTLFAVSREQRASVNDSNRVSKYLAKWGLKYHEVKARLSAAA
jgi:transcriptional regulatory protein RtcR